MNTQIRNVANEMLATQKQVADWQLEQARVVEKQLGHAFETTRAAMGLGRDLTQNLGKAWIDAVVPEKNES